MDIFLRLNIRFLVNSKPLTGKGLIFNILLFIVAINKKLTLGILDHIGLFFYILGFIGVVMTSRSLYGEII